MQMKAEVMQMKACRVCPNGCGDNFYATAHVTQLWKVDGFGNFIETAEDCSQVTHKLDEDDEWACAICGIVAVTLTSDDYEGSFEYGGYHFKPYRKFMDKDGDFRDVMLRNKSDFALGISNYEWSKCDYSYKSFYDAAGSDMDLFRCVENGKIYVPHENELFHYREPE